MTRRRVLKVSSKRRAGADAAAGEALVQHGIFIGGRALVLLSKGAACRVGQVRPASPAASGITNGTDEGPTEAAFSICFRCAFAGKSAGP
ncbi:MAG: hypothetical protein ACK5QX_11710, partial [bacterium]